MADQLKPTIVVLYDGGLDTNGDINDDKRWKEWKYI